MISPARVAAYHALRDASSGRIDLPTALASVRDGLSDDRDRALAIEIATGVERWRAALDHVIGRAAKGGLPRIDPEILHILRLSAYQLLYLTRVPAAAIVDDAVDLARMVRKSSASGFVNAVLRTLSRQRGVSVLPPRPTDPFDRDRTLEYLTVTLSHPQWLAERWLDRFGFEVAERWMQFDNAPGRMTIRVNRFVTSPAALVKQLATHGIGVVPARYAPDALTVVEGNPLRGGADLAGTFIVQDEASQLIALLAGPHPGRRVLDACAAPGGKATAIASTDTSTLLVACDSRRRRIELLARTTRAARATNIRIVQADVLSSLPFANRFDCVLLDAPCSGLGTLRRDPDIRWRRQEADIKSFADAQVRMLRNVASAVTPGGRLVYATCSSEPEENEQVVETFLSGGEGYVLVDARQAHPALPAEVVDHRGHLRSSPDRHGLEAFFGAVFRRL
jgi:16S rRNA (cytosine967-C5)-methyltransferase